MYDRGNSVDVSLLVAHFSCCIRYIFNLDPGHAYIDYSCIPTKHDNICNRPRCGPWRYFKTGGGGVNYSFKKYHLIPLHGRRNWGARGGLAPPLFQRAKKKNNQWWKWIGMMQTGCKIKQKFLGRFARLFNSTLTALKFNIIYTKNVH